MEIFLASLWIFLWEIYGNFVWWWSIVTQFFLQWILGIDIKRAIALDNAAVLWSELGLMIMLLKNHKFEKYFIWLMIFWISGALIWSYLLHLIPIVIMEIIFTWILFCFVIYNFIVPSDKNESTTFVPSRKNILFLGIAILFVSVYNAFMSIGDFVIALFILMYIFHFGYHKSLFIISTVWILVRSAATYNYIQFGYVDWNYLIPMFFSALFAGLIAGYLVQKIHSKYLEQALKYLSVILVLYLIVNILF